MHASAEIPLLIFTLLAQMAVGIIWVGQFATAGNAADPLRKRLQSQRLAAFVFLVLAAILSCFHLGTPSHAPFTIFNIGSSWLSREIFMVILTLAAIGGVIYLAHKDPDSRWLKPLALATSAIGLLLIYVMSMVYNSAFLPGWNTSSTFFLFLASALLLGSFWQGCALGTNKKIAEVAASNSAMWRLFCVALAGFILVAAFMPQAMPEPVSQLNQWSREASPATISAMQIAHAILCGCALLLFMGALWLSSRNRPFAGALIVGLVLVIAGEVVGRMAFYMSYARLGM